MYERRLYICRLMVYNVCVYIRVFVNISLLKTHTIDTVTCIFLQCLRTTVKLHNYITISMQFDEGLVNFMFHNLFKVFIVLSFISIIYKMPSYILTIYLLRFGVYLEITFFAYLRLISCLRAITRLSLLYTSTTYFYNNFLINSCTHVIAEQ